MNRSYYPLANSSTVLIYESENNSDSTIKEKNKKDEKKKNNIFKSKGYRLGHAESNNNFNFLKREIINEEEENDIKEKICEINRTNPCSSSLNILNESGGHLNILEKEINSNKNEDKEKDENIEEMNISIDINRSYESLSSSTEYIYDSNYNSDASERETNNEEDEHDKKEENNEEKREREVPLIRSQRARNSCFMCSNTLRLRTRLPSEDCYCTSTRTIVMDNTKAPNGKPSVIVLGGCGFIGRHLVEYLIENELVSYLRVVDKVPPQTAWLNNKHQKIFENSLIEFRSANLINPISCQNAFASDHPINYVFNCAGETKSGQTDPVYKEGIYKLSTNCAQQAAKIKVEHYVEISSGNLTSSEKMPLKEDDPAEPWTYVAKYKLQVENDLKNISGLKYTVLRPAIVYGCGDRTGLAPRLVIGAVYKHLNEMMKLLWGSELRMNTVHVRDVARAIWHATTRRETIGQTYNLVDEGNSTQGSISAIVSELFNINHDYWGTAMSSLAKMDMNTVVEEINDKHMGPWAEACNKDGVENSPLSPYIDQELLHNQHLNLHPGKLSQSTGFTYKYPKLTKEALKEVLDDYIAMKIFPHSLVL